jgi:hypothetical protein
MSYMDFSSWPREQEQTFVVYEQHASESQKTAITAGIIVALGVLVLMLGIYAGVEPDHRDVTKDMNMSNLTKKQKPGADTAPAPTPAPSTTAPAPDKK